MNNPKFILNQDWTYETEFLGSKSIKTLYKKGEIFESNEDGKYQIIIPTGEITLIDLEGIRSIKINDNLIFDEESEEEFEIIIEEVLEDDENIVKNWRIQLDVKTTRKKLKEIEKIINKMVKPIL
jgi:hypothetical protein